MFAGNRSLDEKAFENALWSQLERLHVLDRRLHPWDARVSRDPHDASFSYSFAGTRFFVVGLHPQSSRKARRFAWPTLVFNAHEQFEQLKAEGRFAQLQARIRERDIALDGVINPNLSDFGVATEARQYSGREVGGIWECPFKPET